ncbi:GNAT family N-acetyltransferase [Larkinella bovis]|uniref:GNAT family N-acetyltransferase n=1 Tax=Larkinella bovis TaxID=683041 RepID=A0ABW0I3K1_9BACT
MLTINFTPFPVLETERLVLRQLEPADQQDLFVLRSSPALMQFIPRPLAKSATDAASLIEDFRMSAIANERITWGITEKTASTVIGTIGYVRILKEHARAELGYLLHADHQGKGLMLEAVRAVIDYGFRVMNLHAIEAIIDPENTASGRVLERSGFRKEGHLRDNIWFNGQFRDSVIYARLVTDTSLAGPP